MIATGANLVFKTITSSPWTVFPNLAREYSALNLGQGFPSFSPPQYIIDAAKNALDSPLLNQYALCAGHPRLVDSLVPRYAPKLGRDTLNSKTEILITCGATEGLFCSINALLNKNDGIVLIEPFYDVYPLAVKQAQAVPKYIPLQDTLKDSSNGTIKSSSSWKVDMEELEASIADKKFPTRMLLINNPQNPVGKVFDRAELEDFAYLAKKYDLIVLSDEVYDSMVYDQQEFTSIASLDGMWERTLTLGSIGKTFSATGWKIGFVFGPEKLITPVSSLHLANTFAIATPLQEASAIGFEQAEQHNYFETHRAEFTKRREILVQGLREIGMNPIVPQGAYFAMVDARNWEIQIDPEFYPSEPQDWRICRHLVPNYNLVCIPPSSFYSPEHVTLGEDYIRLAFCKDISTLKQSLDSLAKIPLRSST